MERTIRNFKDEIRSTLGADFPDDPMEQLLGAITAVFKAGAGREQLTTEKLKIFQTVGHSSKCPDYGLWKHG